MEKRPIVNFALSSSLLSPFVLSSLSHEKSKTEPIGQSLTDGLCSYNQSFLILSTTSQVIFTAAYGDCTARAEFEVVAVGAFYDITALLAFLHLLHNQEYTLLHLLVQISEICPEIPTEDQVLKMDRVLCFEILPAHLAPIFRWDDALRAGISGGDNSSQRGCIPSRFL